MTNDIAKSGSRDLSSKGDVKAILARAKQIAAVGRKIEAHIVFGIDVTASRENTITQARHATAAMFSSIQSLGDLAIKLAYFRGQNECKASGWLEQAERVTNLMRGLECISGTTQIERILGVALNDANGKKVDAVIYIGDHCEENPDVLVGAATKLGAKRIPVVVFHEVNPHDPAAQQAVPVFKEIAKASDGHYCEFNNNSGPALRELLQTLVAFKMHGKAGLDAVSAPTTPQAKRLSHELLHLPPP